MDKTQSCYKGHSGGTRKQDPEQTCAYWTPSESLRSEMVWDLYATWCFYKQMLFRGLFSNTSQTNFNFYAMWIPHKYIITWSSKINNVKKTNYNSLINMSNHFILYYRRHKRCFMSSIVQNNCFPCHSSVKWFIHNINTYMHLNNHNRNHKTLIHVSLAQKRMRD